jgi:hypothetical protein
MRAEELLQRLVERAQLGGVAVAFGDDGAAILDVDEHAGKIDRRGVLVVVDPAVGLDPVEIAVPAAHPVLVRVGAAAPDDVVDGLLQPGLVVGMDGGDDLFQAQSGAAKGRVEAEGVGEGFVDGEAVYPQVPVPGADDRAGGQRQLDPLAVFARQRFAGAQAFFGFAPAGDVVEQDRDLALVRLAHAGGAHVEPAAESFRVTLEVGRLAGPGHAAVGVEPELFEVGREFGHPLAAQVDARFALEGRIGLEEFIVDRPVVVVELDLDDGESGFHRLQQGFETVLDQAQFIVGLFLAGAVAHDLHITCMRAPAVSRGRAVFAGGGVARVFAQGHHFARRPERGAVLAQVPALVVGPASRGGGGHFLLRAARGAVFFGEHAFGRRAQDFFPAPAEDTLGARVPVGEAPVEVGDDNGEIDRAFDDLLKVLG